MMLAHGARRCARSWSAAAAQCRLYAKAVAVKEAEPETIPFPRERAGLSYALNWALAAKAIPPQGDVHHNLSDSQLEEQGARPLESVSGSKIYARGSYSSGATEITKPQFNKLFKEVTQHLSSCSKLYVHDGAVGSAPKFDVKARSISDDSSAALALKNTLCQASVEGHDDIPLSIYIAANHSPKAVEVQTNYMAADYDRSALIVGGKAFADPGSLKRALAAFAAPAIVGSGALPLTARLVAIGDRHVIVAGPEAIVAKNAGLIEASIFPDVGLIWKEEGVARLFYSKKTAVPKLAAPVALVLITIDSTGVFPSVSKLDPGQAAFHYLAGYNGETFTPGYNSGLVSVNPATLAAELSSMLSSTTLPAFLVNASDGKKVVSDKDLLKLIDGAAAGKIPKNKLKQPTEDEVKALKDKYVGFVSKTFPGLPEDIKL